MNFTGGMADFMQMDYNMMSYKFIPITNLIPTAYPMSMMDYHNFTNEAMILFCILLLGLCNYSTPKPFDGKYDDEYDEGEHYETTQPIKKEISFIKRTSSRILSKHPHPYVLCIIDMQPDEFDNVKIVIKNVLKLIRQAKLAKAFVVVAQYTNAGETHMAIRKALKNYPYKAYGWHNKNNKSRIIQTILNDRKIFTRELKVCGVNTEYCVWATVNGLARKYGVPIKVIESACNGTDRIIVEALEHMRTTYKNVEVI